MDGISAMIGDYYGLDWLTLAVGLTGSYLISGGHVRVGLAVGALACVGGMTVAVMSHQTGFIVYNMLIIMINMRGVLRGDRRGMFEKEDTRETSALPAAIR